jgi:hypothetical protein
MYVTEEYKMEARAKKFLWECLEESLATDQISREAKDRGIQLDDKETLRFLMSCSIIERVAERLIGEEKVHDRLK